MTEFESRVNRDSGARWAGRLDVQCEVGKLSAITDGRAEEHRDLRCRWNRVLPE
jgi:hypothetical protein